MERLTKKEDGLYYPTERGNRFTTPDDGSNACRLLQIIGRYEDLMEKYAIESIEYLEQCIKCSDKYGELEEKIGCPLEVRCKLCDGMIIYDEDGKSMGVEHIGEHDFYAYLIGKPYMPRLMYIKGYKKTWWFKADRSE